MESLLSCLLSYHHLTLTHIYLTSLSYAFKFFHSLLQHPVFSNNFVISAVRFATKDCSRSLSALHLYPLLWLLYSLHTYPLNPWTWSHDHEAVKNICSYSNFIVFLGGFVTKYKTCDAWHQTLF